METLGCAAFACAQGADVNLVQEEEEEEEEEEDAVFIRRRRRRCLYS